MTRKNYIELANAFALYQPDEHGSKTQQAQYITWHNLRSEIADVCQRDNPGFDPKRFISATNIKRGF